jgi:glyoxylase-like metal-dependent hydrolase (beta-lactamase superfamily II)
LLVIVVLLGAAGAVLLRVGRSRVGEPTLVKPNLVTVTNAGGISLFAAKVGQHVVFFDTGLDPEGRPLDAALSALGADRSAVSDVFLTHAHMDHVAGASQLPKAKLHLGAADVPLAEGKAEPEALAARVFNKIVPAPPVTITDPITGAASFDVGEGKTIKAFPVPGHTPGSYAFLYDGVLFVGDIVVLKQGQLELPPSLFDPHPDQNKASIRALKMQIAGENVDTVCTAHGGCTPKGLGKNLLDELASRV